MSIATSMRDKIAQLRGLVERGNGDLLALVPMLLERLEEDAEQVEGLENMACINTDVLKDCQEKGGKHAGPRN